MNKKSLLITMEGIDGCGKSSLSQSLVKSLAQNNIDTLLTKEPGSTNLGKKIRDILHSKEFATCEKSEYLLFASDRAQNFEKIIKPALKKNKVIVSDRSGYSSLAYQGYGRRLNKEIIKKVNEWVTDKILYDLIFYIKIDIPTAMDRITQRGGSLTSFEVEKELFWQRVSDGFDEIFKNMKNVIVLNSKKTIEELTKITTKKVLNLLN